ncbi:MAG TPA: RsmE family RNA methyltransferase [Syntrophorhabdaceae bacterium]|nr:RsmE family RNA methyltransferase [Syntrophorhabdaceae bacterium]
MEVRRVFVDKLKMKNGMALVTGPMHKYVVSVLRKTLGDRIDLIDGKGYLYRCVIHSIKSRELYVQILDVVHKPDEKRPKVTLCVSPIKGPRMDWLIEKATELGVEKIVPTIFKRTVVKFEEKEKGKLERWKRIAAEASRQSGRFTVPEIGASTPLRGVAPMIISVKNRIVLYEKEKQNTLKGLFSSSLKGEMCVVIGPEGGIDESEIDWLKENGFTSYTLGESIFRTETTPLVILSIILYEYGKK